MSDNVPPASPPPSGPPPSGPPPSGPPPGAEYLEQGRGAPLPTGAPSAARSGRKRVMIAVGSILGLGVAAGAAFGAYWYLSSGPQPAEALPDTTIAYVSIDLDPSGAQKIDALRTLKKFPSFADKLDFKTDDDIRRQLFEEFEGDLDCPGLDYDDDIAPWLGDRMAVAAVDTGEDDPAPVVALQVKNADDADAGLTKIKACADENGGGDTGGWAINGDWALIAETDAIANNVADDAEESSLADDDTYKKWTDEAGDQGIVTMYAAPAAGGYLVDAIDGFGSSFGLSGDLGSSLGVLPDGVRDSLENFKGAAASIRFDNGSLELEVASDPGLSQMSLFADAKASEVLSTLPADTAAAAGVGFADGWFDDAIEQLSVLAPDSSSIDELIADIESETGLDLPGDAETLAGESVAFAIGSDFDPEVLINSADGSGVPIALKVKGDAAAIEDILTKVRASVASDDATTLNSDSSGDMVVIGPDDDYRGQVLEDGDLGDSEVFKDVVREADRSDAIVFVNFDVGDWLVNLAAGDQEAADNLEPLSGAGLSSWTDDDVAHTVLRITTD